MARRMSSRGLIGFLSAREITSRIGPTLSRRITTAYGSAVGSLTSQAVTRSRTAGTHPPPSPNTGRLMAIEAEHLTRLIDNVLYFAGISDTNLCVRAGRYYGGRSGIRRSFQTEAQQPRPPR